MQNPATNTLQRQADALSVVNNPKPHHRPSLRLLAWAALKAERGQTVCQRRLQNTPAQEDRQVA